MDLVAIIRIAMRALARNKLRSILTMSGIIIGVGAVIAMVRGTRGTAAGATTDRGYGLQHAVRANGYGQPRRHENGVGRHQDADLRRHGG